MCKLLRQKQVFFFTNGQVRVFRLYQSLLLLFLLLLLVLLPRCQLVIAVSIALPQPPAPAVGSSGP